MRRFYVADWQRTPLPLGRLFQLKDFLRDARLIAQIPEEGFVSAISAVEGQEGFLGPRRLRELLGQFVRDDAKRAFTNFIVHFGRLRREEGASEEFAQDVEDELRESARDNLEPQVLETLASRLRRIIEPKPAVERYAKAETVTHKVGASLDELALVCDLRPIFDEEREYVEGMVPVTTLKLAVINQDGFPQTLEVLLSEKQVSTLCEEAERARKKIKVLKQLLQEKKIAMPEAIMTISESSEP